MAAMAPAAPAAAAAVLVAQHAAQQQAALLQLQRSLLASWWQFLLTAGLATQALAAGVGARGVDVQALRAAQARPDLAALPARALDALYDEDAVAALARVWATRSRATQDQAAGATGAYTRQALAVLDVRTRPRPVRLPEQPRGVPQDLVWARPVEQARYARATGASWEEALTALEERLAATAEADVRLADREASRQVLTSVPEVTGYRRVIRPELSASGTCGLCMVASDRLYQREDLLPIHARCKCVVMPVLGERSDPGRALNGQDLQRIYAAAGSNRAADLKRVRIQVVEHGELGPVLAPAGRRPRDAGDVAAARRRGGRTGTPDYAAQAAVLERALPSLEAALAAGDANLAPVVAWRRKRLVELRRLAAA